MAAESSPKRYLSRDLTYRNDLVSNGILFTLPEEAVLLVDKYSEVLGMYTRFPLTLFFQGVGRISHLDALGVTLWEDPEIGGLNFSLYPFVDLRNLDQPFDTASETLERFGDVFGETLEKINGGDIYVGLNVFATQGSSLIRASRAFLTEMAIGQAEIYQPSVPLKPCIAEISQVI